MKNWLKFFIIIVLGFASFYGCQNDYPVIENLSGSAYSLLNQDSIEIKFPEIVKGKLTVIGYIFTNCPDICPLTTNNMRLIQEKVRNRGITGVEFIAISFDPEFDNPSILKKYTEIRQLDLSNWSFLTGEKNIIDSLLKQIGIFAVPGDSTITSDGNKIYFYIHTDRISIMDENSRIIKNYRGSEANIDEIVKDINKIRHK